MNLALISDSSASAALCDVIAETPTRTRAARANRPTPRRRLRGGGADGNERLTALTAVVLLVLLAVEGVTLLSLRSLLSVHVFVGMLLVPIVALKLASTGWRFVRYYTGHGGYRHAGPPSPLLRFLVAPVLVATTISLFGSGIALVAFGPGHPLLVGLHKASFVVWFGATGIHVLAYALRLPQLVGADLGSRGRLPGARVRQTLLGVAVAAGAIIATAVLPSVSQWHGWLFG